MLTEVGLPTKQKLQVKIVFRGVTIRTLKLKSIFLTAIIYNDKTRLKL